MLVTDQGAVYVWGCGEHGQLGHGDYETKFVPLRVRALEHERVTSIACGQLSTICISVRGMLLTPKCSFLLFPVLFAFPSPLRRTALAYVVPELEKATETDEEENFAVAENLRVKFQEV